MRIKITCNFLLLLVTSIAWCQQKASVKVASIFGDNMVIQQGIHAPIWGTASPGQKLSVVFDRSVSNTKADSKGVWMVRMPVHKAGGPYKLVVSAASNSAVFSNVMVGEVWLASGQSNMQFSLPGVINAAEEIKAANYPNIRFFTVENAFSNYPLSEVQGSWKPSNPDNAKTFSAVAYFFARQLYKDKDVPVGIISSSWGGTPSEAWTSAEMLATHPDFKDSIAAYKRVEKDWLTIFKNYQEKNAAVRNSNKGIELGVHEISYNDSDWRRTQFPIGARPAGSFMWFRKNFNLDNVESSPYKLNLSNVVGEIDVYVNGHSLTEEDPAKATHVYSVPANYLKTGSNLLAIRHIVFWQQGKMGTQPGDFTIVSPSKVKTELNGEWHVSMKIDEKFPVIPPYKNYPTALYNAMIAPLVPYGIKGVIWYQGENNASRAVQYRTLFPMLINDWRNKWASKDLPFLFVQLANFRERKTTPTSDDWALEREAQAMALKLPKTGMAVAIDIGDPTNIHPKNKQDVGKRLYLAARKVAYNEPVVFSGPTFQSMTVNKNRLIINFENTGSGLKVKGEALKGFAIAGADKIFHWADASVEGNKVIVSSNDVPNPIAVRYAWSTNPECNLYNKEDLPASPFRTDNW